MASPRHITRDQLGAWLLKARPGPGWLPEPDDDGRLVFHERCVSRNYRSELLRPGDPVLLWVSGPRGGRGPTPGIWGVGRTTGAARTNQAGQFAVELELPLADDVLVPRDELLTHPSLCTLEVLTMPAGSNPSWVSRGQWQELQELLP